MHLPSHFPNLTPENHSEDSSPTKDYNCHAWAVGFTDRWFDHNNYWPDPVTRGEALRNYQRAYESIGFRVCGGWNVEEGFEKIAIYENNRRVTHTARLLNDGRWTSKMGKSEDITHTRDALDGPLYGRIVLIMRRKLLTP